MTLGERLRDARKHKGLTQVETADYAGISVNSLRLYEADKRKPRFETLCSIADALGVKWQNLLQEYIDSKSEPLNQEDNVFSLLCFALENPTFITFLSSQGLKLGLRQDNRIVISWNGKEVETSVEELTITREIMIEKFKDCAREVWMFDIPTKENDAENPED